MSRPALHVAGQPCSIDGCHRPAEPHRSECRGHRGQRERGAAPQPIREQGVDPAQGLVEAALELADAPAEDDVEYERRKRCLFWWARKYAGAECS